MRPLPVPLLLLLLSPVPGRPGGCPPCPPDVPEPCDSRCPPCARARSPAEEEPEEPCPPCPPCAHEAEGTPPAPGEPRVTPPVPPPEPPGDIIPLYCALLAALVVGLLAYVAFKCWDTCRKKRQLDKARDAGDAEKLRGDSGGLEGSQAPPPEAPALSPRRQEEPGELERLLERGPGTPGTAGDATSAV
ncbi:death domain-containing membrane protein NRADD-like [Prinia subflava]|uniref:death domain-containing membrane protein NRADD-like n=1 Tax=Prinia subflava TaxID=208062 RepID=UPI002FE16AC5